MSNNSVCGAITSELVTDDPSFADLIGEFVDGLDARVQAIQEAIDAQALDTVESLAHQLKGAGGGYGYPALSQVSAQLEKRANSEDVTQCGELLDELRSLLARIKVGTASTA